MTIRLKLSIIFCSFAILIMSFAGLSYFALGTLSTVRALVAGEGLWSKAQKNAFYYLSKYLETHNPTDYQAYLDHLSICRGDQLARVELQNENPDFSVVERGLIQGKNHPNEVLAMGKLFSRFRSVSYLRQANQIWAAADELINDVEKLAKEIHDRVQRGALDNEVRTSARQELSILNDQLSILEDNFSFFLGEASRWMHEFFVSLTLVFATAFVTVGAGIAFALSKGFLKSIETLQAGTAAVESGQYGNAIAVLSQDELGQLARSFNRMSEGLVTALAERDLAHAQITNSSRLAALGEMAGAVAHEINTPLSSILMCGERIRSLSKSEDETPDRLSEINEYSEILVGTVGSVAKIINGLRHFARDGKNDSFDDVDLVSVVNQALSLCSERMKFNGISPQFIKPAMPTIVSCRSVEIGQVVLNLLNNAFDAILENKVKGAWLRISIVDHGDFVRILVSDSGKGIPSAIVSRLFDPFFTTKGPSKGTGLGLSISKGIAERHGGRVYLDEQGPHTTFVVELPKSHHRMKLEKRPA